VGENGAGMGGGTARRSKCEVLPAASHFAWLYKYRCDLRKRKSPAFRVIESTLMALAFYFRVKKNRMKGNETEIN